VHVALQPEKAFPHRAEATYPELDDLAIASAGDDRRDADWLRGDDDRIRQVHQPVQRPVERARAAEIHLRQLPDIYLEALHATSLSAH